MNPFLLKNKHLLTLGLAETVSGVGNWITMMAVFSILIFKGGGDIWQSSGIMLAGLLPLLVCSPLAGQLADRFNKKYLMIASELLGAVAVMLIFITRRPEWILVLVAVQAAASSLLTPARQSIIPALVAGPAELSRANAFLQQLASFTKIGAPVLAGFLIGLLGAYNAMLLDVASFGLSAGMLWLLPDVRPLGQHCGAAGSTGANANLHQKSLWTVLHDIPPLRLLFVAAFLMIISIIAFDILGSLFIRDVLGQAENFFGLVIGAVGCGTVLTGFYLLARRDNLDPWQDLKLGLFLLIFLPALLVAAGLLGRSPLATGLALAGAFVGGVGVGFLTIQSSTLLQMLAPSRLLGTVSGYFQAVIVAGQLISIVGVPLLVPGLVSITFFFLLTALALGLVLIYLTLSLSLLRRRQLAGSIP
ncbi:MAG: MFS transporter [Chloroflexota bacterium]